MVKLYESRNVAIKTDGSLWTWGCNKDYGVLGDNTTENKYTPVKIMDNVAAVRLGSYCSAAIQKDGSLWMWGYNEDGALGDGSTEDKHFPVKVMDRVVEVSLGAWHSAAIQADGSLWMWGSNRFGQLGDGTDEDKHIPVKVMDNVTAVELGTFRSAALQTDGSLWMWGDNDFGELGDGTTEDKHSPVKVMDGLAFAERYPTVKVNGQTVDFIDQKAMIKDSRTLVPARGVFESLGATVGWNDATQTATVQKGTTFVQIPVGQSYITVNDVKKELDVPAQLIGDRTMIPVRAVAEAFSCTVDWDDETYTVSIVG